MILLASLPAGGFAADASAWLRLRGAPVVSAGLSVACIVEANAQTCPPQEIQYGLNRATGAIHVWGNGRLVACTDRQQDSAALPILRAENTYVFRLYLTGGNCAEATTAPEPVRAQALALMRVSPVVRPRPGVGGNVFSLVPSYVGWRPNGTGRETDEAEAGGRVAMSKMALDDARTAGLSFIRVPVLGYGATTPVIDAARVGLDFDIAGVWYADRGRYWSAMQSLFDDLQARNLRVVPTVNWTIDQFVMLANNDVVRGGGNEETTRDFIRNPDSRAARLMRTYLAELVNGYSDANGSFAGARRHPALNFYEYGNETNLQLDLDRNRRCRNASWYEPDPVATCRYVREFTTAELIAHYNSVVRYWKTLDPYHFISAGHSLPRVNAEHLRACPEWVAANTCPASRWASDSRSELIRNLLQINKPFDLVSVHFYAREDGSHNRFCENDCADPLAASLLDRLVAGLAPVNKSLYIGEFGDKRLHSQQESGADSFPRRVLERIASLKLPYSSLWLWRDNVFASYADYAMAWDASRTPESVRQLRAASAELGFDAPPQPDAASDVTAPNLLVTWPRTGQQIERPTMIHALASDDSLAPPRVEALLDGASLGVQSGPGYRWPLLPTQLPADRGSVLTLVACDAALIANCTSRAIPLGLPPGPQISATATAGLLDGTLVVKGTGFGNDAGTLVELYDIGAGDPALRAPDASFSCATAGVTCSTAALPHRLDLNLRSAALFGNLVERFRGDGFFVRIKRTTGGFTRHSRFSTARQQKASDRKPGIAFASYGTDGCRGLGTQWYWYCVELGGSGLSPDAMVEVRVAGPMPVLIDVFPARPLNGPDGSQVVRFYLGDEAAGMKERLFDNGELRFRIVNPSDGPSGRASGVVGVE